MDELGSERKRRRLDDEVFLSQQSGSSCTLEGEEQQTSPATELNSLEAGSEELVNTVAKWCRGLKDGTYSFQSSTIRSFLSQASSNDKHLMSKLVNGTSLSAQLHPLIFVNSSETDSEMVWLRSLPYFEQLLADPTQRSAKYQSLSDDQKRIVAVGIRDMFIGSLDGLLNEREETILHGIVDMMDETVGCVQVQGISVCFHPSATYTVIKYIEDLDGMLEQKRKPFFAQIMDGPRLFAVFVNPTELSFHNFENIVPLDRWVEQKLAALGDSALSLSLSQAAEVRVGSEVLTCKLRGPSSDLVRQLPSLDLYVPPLNKGSRGGERFIFHSSLLSTALTTAVRSSNVLSKLSQGRLTESYRFVNYVFRCNKFAPGDAKFSSHLDTPYYDGARSEVSKYTLLIYLSTGHAEPALRVGDVELNEIEEMTCVIFDQRLEHEGQCFVDADKIFIRSELVFEDKNLQHNKQAGCLFSEACYMTSQSVFDNGLSAYAHECYERANSLHWAIEREAALSTIYLHKQYQQMTFVTNGYDYWFPKTTGLNYADCGMLAVLDYFNCKINNQPFRAACKTTSSRERSTTVDNIWAWLMNHQEENTAALKRLRRSDISILFKQRSDTSFVRRQNPWADEDEDGEDNDSEGDACCPSHGWSTFDAWDSKDVREAYDKCCNYTRRRFFGVPLLILNQEVVINEEHITVDGDKLFFLRESSEKPLPRINFASCWLDTDPSMFINVGREVSAPSFLIPPLLFHELEEGYHLVLDFFRNDWVVSVDDQHKMPVPVINNDLDLETGTLESVFLTQAEKSCPDFIESLRQSLDGEV